MQDIYLTTLFQEIAYLSILMQEQHVHISGESLFLAYLSAQQSEKLVQ